MDNRLVGVVIVLTLILVIVWAYQHGLPAAL
jgi:hypothetical protein